MKKLICTIVFVLAISFSGRTASPLSNYVPTHMTDKPSKRLSSKDKIKVAQMKVYTSLSLKEYETLKGKKLNFLEKKLFKSSRKRMNQMLKSYDDGYGPTMLQKMSWFLKGMLLGPIAVALAYIFLKDDERELIKWTWFGFIGFVALVLIVVISLL